jgi:hypothetical protein
MRSSSRASGPLGKGGADGSAEPDAASDGAPLPADGRATVEGEGLAPSQAASSITTSTSSAPPPRLPSHGAERVDGIAREPTPKPTIAPPAASNRVGLRLDR